MASNPDPEDWYISCSDDEKYSSTGCPRGKLDWTPKPEAMVRLYEKLDKEGVDGLQLDWKCPNGRRPRTPASESGEEESDDEELADIDRLHMRSAADTSNFDFNDEGDAPTTTPRRPPGASFLQGSNSRELKGSARKKTTELSKILSKMERNRINDARDAASKP